MGSWAIQGALIRTGQKIFLQKWTGQKILDRSDWSSQTKWIYVCLAEKYIIFSNLSYKSGSVLKKRRHCECSICAKDLGFWFKRQMTTDEAATESRSHVLLHQLKHAVYFEPIWRCIDCPYTARCTSTIYKHIRNRKDCPYLENRIEELYQLSEKKIDGHRIQFRQRDRTYIPFLDGPIFRSF